MLRALPIFPSAESVWLEMANFRKNGDFFLETTDCAWDHTTMRCAKIKIVLSLKFETRSFLWSNLRVISDSNYRKMLQNMFEICTCQRFVSPNVSKKFECSLSETGHRSEIFQITVKTGNMVCFCLRVYWDMLSYFVNKTELGRKANAETWERVNKMMTLSFIQNEF